MAVFFEIFVCCLAVFGVYAIFVRLVAWQNPVDDVYLAIKADAMPLEEVCALAEYLRLRAELDGRVQKKTVVLLAEENAEQVDALRREGFLVYIRK